MCACRDLSHVGLARPVDEINDLIHPKSAEKINTETLSIIPTAHGGASNNHHPLNQQSPSGSGASDLGKDPPALRNELSFGNRRWIVV
jgi:hypothetical protein